MQPPIQLLGLMLRITNRKQRLIESASQRPAMVMFIDLLHSRVKMAKPGTSVGAIANCAASRIVLRFAIDSTRSNRVRVSVIASWQNSETMVLALSALLLIVLMASTVCFIPSFS
ncbi:hypothetical protein WI75_26240 [Burkholderia ubonensis]|nr:hypothetical protein WI75_26240 [Burkholderia ubonensis]KVL63048.1 hypothetical protein WJ48_24035 [Burkholderia ubonensis]KVL76927.1 hypothetical protein WJ49_11285 [Burkholderia ubonensis]KVL91667.1 hypothetical protein WJ50_00470 [Burkholderia ubonensis]